MGRTGHPTETAPAIEIINNTATKDIILMKRIMCRVNRGINVSVTQNPRFC